MIDNNSQHIIDSIKARKELKQKWLDRLNRQVEKLDSHIESARFNKKETLDLIKKIQQL